MVSLEDVWGKLGEVFDPEMDQPLTTLGFIENVEIKQEDVTVYLRLPTFWCSPNFAYWMMHDIVDEVSKLEDVKSVRVLLKDHFEAERLNEGIGKGKSFEECFADESLTGGLDELRRAFNEKSFISRQADLAAKMMEAGIRPEGMACLTVSDIGIDDARGDIIVRNSGTETRITQAGHAFQAYHKKRLELGLRYTSESRLFVNTKGDPLGPEDLKRVREKARLINLNFTGNALLCTSLLSSRYNIDKGKDIVTTGLKQKNLAKAP